MENHFIAIHKDDCNDQFVINIDRNYDNVENHSVDAKPLCENPQR
jgi:hypothetical protein